MAAVDNYGSLRAAGTTNYEPMSAPSSDLAGLDFRGKKRSRWFQVHFWIGWVAAVPIALVCLTGGLLIFEREIFQWEHPELFQLEPIGVPLSVQQALDRYGAAEPRLRVNHLGLPQSPRHSYSAYCTEIMPEGNRGARVFLNPYTGEFSRMDAGFSLSHVLIDVHRHLAAGKGGQRIVAISSVTLAITCLIGVVLWWPLRGSTFSRARKRGNALDWHNVLGLVSIGPLFVMALTGILFTWGRQVWPLLENFQDVPSQAPTPTVANTTGGEVMSMDPIVDQIQVEFPRNPITGIQPGNGKNAVKVILDASDRPLQLFVDPYTGEELMRVDGSGLGPVSWLRRNFGRIHTFGPFHLAVRIWWGLSSIAGTILVVTGLWVSVKRWRRPSRIQSS